MPLRAPEPLHRLNIHLFAADIDELNIIFRDTGISAGVRRVVRLFLSIPPELRKELWELYKHKGEI